MQESQTSSTWRVKWYFTATGGGLGFGWKSLSRVEVNQIAIARVRKMHVTVHASAVDVSNFLSFKQSRNDPSFQRLIGRRLDRLLERVEGTTINHKLI